MDLRLWGPSDDQGYLESFQSNHHTSDVQQCGHYYGYELVPDKSGYCNEDYLLCDFCFGYGRDMIEEDALNEKSCLQVLKILVGKADEEIVNLEEYIVMLQCKQAWDDEDWSVPSAALREKIDHLNILIQSLKKERTEDVHYPPLQLEQPVELPHSLHDILKPLLENYLVKSKQTGSSIIKKPVLPTAELSKKNPEASTVKNNKKIEEKECTAMLKNDKRGRQTMELEERKIDPPQQKKDAVSSKFNATAHKCATSKLSEQDINNPNRRQGQKIGNLSLLESGRRSSVKSEVDRMKLRTESSSKAQKARVYRHAINKNVLSTKPSVKMKSKMEAQETGGKYSSGAFSDKTEHAREPKMKLEHQIQVQQIHQIETLIIKQAKLISASQADGQGPWMECKADPESVQYSFVAGNIDVGSSFTENLKGLHKYGVLEKISKKGEKAAQQQLKGNNINAASEDNVASISSQQNVTKLSLSSQTIRKRKGLRDFLIKLVKMESDTSSSTTEEATYGVRDVPQNSSPCIKDVERLTLNDLKVIARNRKMRGYSKLRKADLQKCLGLEPSYLRQKAHEK